MPEGETHAGSWLGDLTNEWKKAKTPERVIIVGAIAATVGIALYLHNKSTGPNQPGASGLAGLPSNLQQGTPGGGTGGGTTPVSNPTQPPATKPPTTPTTPNKPIPKPTPIFKATPIIRQPTQVTKVAASVNHARSAPKPPQYPHRPGGNYGIVPVAPPKPPPDYSKANAPYVHPVSGPR
jgi:hypothetical protein